MNDKNASASCAWAARSGMGCSPPSLLGSVVMMLLV